jgi:quinol monooxygenase YgiN
VLINEFNIEPGDVERFLEVWAGNLAVTKQQPGFISMQAYRGTAGSTTFGMMAIWESAEALSQAFLSPEFQALAANYPDSTVAAPHVFKKLAVAGICVA